MSVFETIRAAVDQAEQAAAASDAQQASSPIVAELNALAVPLDPVLEQLIASQIRAAGAAAAKAAELSEAASG